MIIICRLRRKEGHKKKEEQAETATKQLGVPYVVNTVGDNEVANTIGNDEVANTVGDNEGINKKDYQHEEAALPISVRVRVRKHVRAKLLSAIMYHTDEMASPSSGMEKG